MHCCWEVAPQKDMNSSGEDNRRYPRGGMVQIQQQDHPMLQTEVKKTTHYPYKEPRIDQKMYQAEIPSLKGRTSNRATTRGSSSPRVGEKAVRYSLKVLHRTLKSDVDLRPALRLRSGVSHSPSWTGVHSEFETGTGVILSAVLCSEGYRQISIQYR